MSGRLIGPKYWNRSAKILGTHLDNPWQCRDCFGCLCCKLCINCVLVSRRPEMGMEFGPTKWNQCWVSGLPMDSPLFCFGTVKISPGFV